MMHSPLTAWLALACGGALSLITSDARADLVFALPTYTFAQPVAGAQAALGVMASVGAVRVSTDVTLSGPAGQAVKFEASDPTTDGADLYGLSTLKWGRDEHNFMTYAMVGAPAGAYERRRLANVGTKHWSVDAGGGHTYFDPRTRREFSAVAGVTYKLENPDTDYRNGVDAHSDWAASPFFPESLHAGIVGYFYRPEGWNVWLTVGLPFGGAVH